MSESDVDVAENFIQPSIELSFPGVPGIKDGTEKSVVEHTLHHMIHLTYRESSTDKITTCGILVSKDESSSNINRFVSVLSRLAVAPQSGRKYQAVTMPTVPNDQLFWPIFGGAGGAFGGGGGGGGAFGGGGGAEGDGSVNVAAALDSPSEALGISPEAAAKMRSVFVTPGQRPSCCCKCCCPQLTVCAHEGCTINTCITWVFFPYALCCWCPGETE